MAEGRVEQIIADPDQAQQPNFEAVLGAALETVWAADHYGLTSIAAATAARYQVIIKLHPCPYRADLGWEASLGRREWQRAGNARDTVSEYTIVYPYDASNEYVRRHVRHAVGHEVAHIALRHSILLTRTVDTPDEQVAANFFSCALLALRGRTEQRHRLPRNVLETIVDEYGVHEYGMTPRNKREFLRLLSPLFGPRE